MARSTMSSAMSVSRSLTCISGSTPVRSATATRNSAARWNWRSASTCCSGSSSRSCSRRASSSAAQLARVGSCVSSRSSISSSSSSGYAAICAARNSPCRHTSTSRARAAAFSCSSAKYAERLPMASMMASTRRSTGSCGCTRATSASSAGSSACRRLRPGSSSRRTRLEARSSSSRRATSALSAKPAACSASAERGGLGLAVPEASQVDAHRAGLGTAAGKHHLAEVPADAGAVCLELGAQRSPSRRAPWRGRCARASARPPGRRCTCASSSICRRFSSRRRNTYAARSSVTVSAGSSRVSPRRGERGEQRRRLQAAVAAAARQLQRLHDELDLADAARAELDVVGQLAPLHLALDQRLHLPQALEHAVVEVAAVDERTDGGGLDLGVALGARSPGAP